MCTCYIHALCHVMSNSSIILHFTPALTTTIHNPRGRFQIDPYWVDVDILLLPLSCMMSFHSRYTDARRSTFNNVGGDQYNLIRPIIVITNSSPDQTLRDLHRDLGHVSRSATSSPTSLSPRGVLTRPYHSGAGSAGDVAAALIVKIVQLLIDHRGSPNDNRAFKLELEILHQILTLTGLAIQTYAYTPLGQSLANNIIPEVEKCCVVLHELFHKINTCRQGLYPTSIGNLWHQVWWSGNEVDGVSSLRARLSTHQRSLGEFLVALNSYVYRTLMHWQLNRWNTILCRKFAAFHGRNWETDCAQVMCPSKISMPAYSTDHAPSVTFEWTKYL